MSRSSLGGLFGSLALFLWGCAVCLSVGRVGFMPLDQSIVFDGAWRLLSGQVPFRDFTTPDGLTPIGLQVLFFKAFGVTWFAYCLHAAVFNGLFCCLVYGLLRALASGGIVALLYGGLSGVVFYPPFGTPFRDQHAFFFALSALLMGVVATNRPRGPVGNLLWILVPLAFALGYLSKPIPTLFVVPIVLLYLLLRKRDRACSAVVLMGAGTVLAVSAILVLGWVLRVDGELVRVYFFGLTGETGFERLETLTEPGRLFVALVHQKGFSQWSEPGTNVLIVLGLFLLAWYAALSRRSRRAAAFKAFALLSTTVLSLAAAIGAMVLAYKWEPDWVFGEIGPGLLCVAGFGCLVALGRHEKIRQVRRSLSRCFPEMTLAAGMAVTSLIFAFLSAQGYENAMALVFAGMGLAQLCLMRVAGAITGERGSGGMLRDSFRRSLRALPWSVAVLATVQGFSFHRSVNVDRSIHELHRGSARDLSGSIVSPALAFMIWDVPGPARGGVSSRQYAQAMSKTLRFLEEQDENFLLIGDSSILYALTRCPSVSPSLWFHPGLTIPPEGTEPFEDYQRRLIENMDRYGVRFVVLEGERTWVATRLSDFPMVENLVRQRRFREFRYGPFRIVELSPSRTGGNAGLTAPETSP